MSTDRSDKFAVRDRFRRSHMRGKAALVLATWFGCGLAPLAPGTIGTLAAVPLVLAFHRLALPLRAGALAAVVMVAIWSAGVCEKILDRRDPKVIVIDEVVGFLLTMAFLPLSALSFWLGLALFRFFDIAKPFPIRTIDRNVQGGLGVVADDLVAGVFAGCTTMAAMGMGRWLN